MTHPFHPFSGQQLPVVYFGSTSADQVVVVQQPDETLLRIPLQWTDLARVDDYSVLGEGCSRFRLSDLQALGSLVRRLVLKHSK